MIMDDLGTDEHGLKRHGWAARWEWLNLNKGYTSIDTARYRRAN